MSKKRMLSLALGVGLLIMSTMALTPPGNAAGSDGAYPADGQWTLVWSDEFNGAKGSPPDKTRWSYDIGGASWGNNEMEYYTNKPGNVFQQDGHLVLRALEQDYEGFPYTSGRIKTRNKFEPTYGRFEGRIKIPYGQGIWPAFWMLGNTIGTTTWPNCGEIDIMENIGREPSTVHATVHGPGYSGSKGIGRPYTLPGDRRFADDFHIFALEWEPNVIRWYVDGELYQTLTLSSLPAGTDWVFDHPFYLILNVAVGGGWPGYPDETSTFPQSMLVDYVRVYQRK